MVPRRVRAAHAYGIQETPEGRWPDGVRLATEADLDAMVELEPVLSDHQAQSPVFARGIELPSQEELRADLLEDMAKEEVGDIVFERDGKLVGAFQVAAVELSSVHSGLARPPGAASSAGRRPIRRSAARGPASR